MDAIGTDAGEGPATLVDLVAGELREKILEGWLKPGARIRQEAVARQFGTSRIPVREALRQLQSEGLVTLVPNVGARVGKLDLGELDEIYQIRERLEPLAIAQSTMSLSDEELAVLCGYVEEMEAIGGSDEKRWHELDRRFHFEIYRAASLPRLLGLIERCWEATERYRRVYTLLPAIHEHVHEEHRLILDALERRNPDDAERLLAMHIGRVRRTLADHLELFEE